MEEQLESSPSSSQQSNRSSPSHSNTSENNSLNTCSTINSCLAIDNIGSNTTRSLDVLPSQSPTTSLTESALQESGNNELTMLGACDEGMDTMLGACDEGMDTGTV